MTSGPLDQLHSIKVKLGIIIVASVVISIGVVVYGWQTGIRPRYLVGVTGVVALVMIQVLAHGLTKPLREMAAATERIAAGDFDVHVSATSQDEVGQLVVAFNAMAARIAELDRERRALIANASHELRTPLAAVRARLENVVDGVEPADGETLGSVLRSVERLGRLVDQLLDLSRLEGDDPLDVELFALRDVVDAAVEEIRLRPTVAPIDVTIDGDPVVIGDPARIHQVIVNLVENADRHTPAGGRIEVRAAATAGGGVAFSVADSGPGIAPSEAEAVFDRFYRADRSRYQGSGLGLAIVRSIVDLHTGRISVGSNPAANGSGGCVMTVTLPSGATAPATTER